MNLTEPGGHVAGPMQRTGNRRVTLEFFGFLPFVHPESRHWASKSIIRGYLK